MLSLDELQEQFMLTVIGANKNKILDYIKDNGKISSADRFEVHRQTIFDGYENALKIVFPGIWQLVGDDCAKGVALAFSHKLDNLPKKACLNNWGENFPDFLSSFPSTKSLPYLKDYAKLEWLQHKSYNAKRGALMTPSDLHALTEKELESAKLLFHPSVFFMESKYRLDKIHDLLNDKTNKGFDLTIDPTYVIANRANNKVNTLWVEGNLWRFLLDLRKGANITQSIENSKAREEDLDLSELFIFILQHKLVSKISL